MTFLPTQLTTAEWKQRDQLFRSWGKQWTHPFRKRRSHGQSHPVWDFLFLYYRFPPSQLENWHPGPGVRIQVPASFSLPHAPFTAKAYRLEANQLYLDPTLANLKTVERWKQSKALLEATRAHPPMFGCHGLHEWAMVYRGGNEGWIRHAKTLPLRLSQPAIDQIVESLPMCCSHFDAFRFFTPSARPLNKLQPTFDQRLTNEQPGCLHANMDLYKWAAHAMPWIGSDLLRACFQLAVQARELDMRASPYDVRPLGFTPIPIETPAGRATYEAAQRTLSEEAQPLRDRLITSLTNLIKLNQPTESPRETETHPTHFPQSAPSLP